MFQRYWHDDSVNVFRVYLTPGAKVPEVKRRILERYAGERQVFVLTNAELKGYILKITDQWFGLTSVQIAVAVLVAILGIVNTLTVSITDRRRELGVLQAVGGLHGQIRRTIWIEALSIGALGLVLGFALGAVNLYYILQIVHRDIAGMRLDYTFPVHGDARRWCRRFWRRRSSRRSGRRSRRCTARWWRRWSMNSGQWARRHEHATLCVWSCSWRRVFVAASVAHELGAADDARQIVDEAQRRTDAKSQRYEGLLQVFDAKGKISDKRWTFERLGRTARARRSCASRRRRRSKASRCSSSTIRTARRISGCGRRRSSAIGGSRCRIARRGSSAPISASRISRSATSTSTSTRCSARKRSTARRAGRSSRRRSRAKSSQYTRSIVWIRKDNYAFARIENFVKDQVVRRLNYSDIRNVQGIWTARQLEMTDLRRGSRTRLTLDKLEYNVPLKEEDFTLQAIRRQ